MAGRASRRRLFAPQNSRFCVFLFLARSERPIGLSERTFHVVRKLPVGLSSGVKSLWVPLDSFVVRKLLAGPRLVLFLGGVLGYIAQKGKIKDFAMRGLISSQ